MGPFYGGGVSWGETRGEQKTAENKKKIPDPKENSFLNKLKKFFKK